MELEVFIQSGVSWGTQHLQEGLTARSPLPGNHQEKTLITVILLPHTFHCDWPAGFDRHGCVEELIACTHGSKQKLKREPRFALFSFSASRYNRQLLRRCSALVNACEAKNHERILCSIWKFLHVSFSLMCVWNTCHSLRTTDRAGKIHL